MTLRCTFGPPSIVRFGHIIARRVYVCSWSPDAESPRLQATSVVGSDGICRKIQLSNKSLNESAAMVVAETLSTLTEVCGVHGRIALIQQGYLMCIMFVSV